MFSESVKLIKGLYEVWGYVPSIMEIHMQAQVERKWKPGLQT